MNHTGGFVYANHAEAEERVEQYRSSLLNLIGALADLNKSIDSLKLQQLIEQQQFNHGL